MPTPAILAIQKAVSESGIAVIGKPVIVRRKIKGTDLWSQHSYGNAIDYYGIPAAMEDLYQSLLAAKRAGKLPVATLCHKGRGGCTTAHTGHVHVDGKPHQTGTPGDRSGGTPVPDTGFFDLGSALAGASGIPGVPGSEIISGALAGLNVGNPFAAITNPLDAVAGGIARLFDPQTYLRVLWFVGGAVAIGAGTVWIARELGINVPRVGDIAALTPAGAVAKAVT